MLTSAALKERNGWLARQGLNPQQVFGASGDLQLWQCPVTNSPEKSSQKALRRDSLPSLPCTLSTGQATEASRGVGEVSGVCRPGQGHPSRVDVSVV